ncbi:hypothetical protein M408DRAFT_88820 [Serendipita vermifera MAFF 305830]|uniref:Potassium channel domain-containing protein n=1 Tax=Serendipita vermifera MAFF 305830 TaxID=933852 RepID=A0A0C2XYQ0_SERVB|nr:hypothetical protein M408DRAFT_88820 [Serendipita vermifera MAFF 305830]
MSLLPTIVSILTFNYRKNFRDSEEGNKNDEKGQPADHRIDIPSPDSQRDNGISSSSEKLTNERPPRRKPRRTTSISSTSVAVAKKPYTWSRRALRATRKFVFEPDKGLEEGYAPKYRYLPILSGLIVPFSILLEVPGLTEHWYQRQEGLEVIEYQANPTLLNIGLGFSIASAVIANICLILRFLERRIGSATVAAICFLLIHDAINITALIWFGVVHAVDDGFTYSQAYYVTLASTIVSLVVTTTLIIDYLRTKDFTKSGSGLTRKQRSLVIIVMVLLTYLGFGALVYCYILGIAFLDALYFSVCSSLTIGFGDISPSTPGSQVFSVFYNTFGILNTGLAIAIARETIIEAFEQSYRNRKHAIMARRKMHREMHAKQHAVKHGLWLTAHKVNDHLPVGTDIPVSPHPPTPPAPQPSLKGDSKEKLSRPKPDPTQTGSPTPSAVEKGAGAEELVDDPYYAEKLEEEVDKEGETAPDAVADKEPKERPHPVKHTTGASTKSKQSTETSGKEKGGNDSRGIGEVVTDQREEAQEQVRKIDDHMVAGFEDEESEYIKFRQNMVKEAKKEFRAKLSVSWSLFFIFWFVGGAIFMASEGWTYGTAIYFCFTAFSTIGYGDVAPKSGPGRVCFIAWSLLGVGTMTILISVLSEAYQSRYSTMLHNGLFDKAIRNYQNKTHTNKQSSQPSTPNYDKDAMSPDELRQALGDTRLEMAAIPPKIIAQAKVFHAHLQYVLTHNTQDKPPPGLQRALDELMDEEAMNEELRKEVLQDGEARRTLFMMSFERTLKRMVENAERISKLIEEHDALEEGLDYGAERGDNGNDDNFNETNDDDGDDGFTESPRNERFGDKTDCDQRQRSTLGNWAKLRSGLLSAKALRSSANRRSSRANVPYMHERGSQSEPRLTVTEEEEEGDVDERHPKEKKGTGINRPSFRKSKSRPPPLDNQPSQPSGVRFADNPYGDSQNAVED